jgi:hypothetical protein
MNMAKGRKTGGRQRGTPNKASVEREKVIAESGLTPLKYMLRTLRDESLDLQTRMDAASKAAPYVHPKLAAIEHSGPNKGPIQSVSMTPGEFEATAAKIAAEV